MKGVKPMKYTAENVPLLCIQSESACYKNTSPMTVRGVLWHSTGANNPTLKRYVQPADDDPNRQQLLDLIGVNQYANDYNHGNKDRQMGVNAWIGKLANGTVATVQALPWGWKPWGCGAGDKGSCNDGWIQFEICEDGLTDPGYAQIVYYEACQLTAFLCAMYGLDPHGTVRFKGVDVPVIIDHRTSHLLGLGNNHGDVAHWFPKLLGKTLDNIRDDVAAILQDADVAIAPQLDAIRKGSKGSAVKVMQEKLLQMGYDLGKWGADGDFGSATESAVKEFQANHALPVTGVADAGVLAAIDAALSTFDGEVTYTVTLRGLTEQVAKGLKACYPDCEVTRE